MPTPETLVRGPRFVPGGQKVRQALDRSMFRAKSGKALWSDPTTDPIFLAPAGTMIFMAAFELTVAWTGGTPSVLLGDAGNTSRLLAAGDITEATPAFYGKAVFYEYTAETYINATLSASLAAGEGYFWVVYAASNIEVGK